MPRRLNLCADAGADVLVAGSYIFDNKDRKEAINSIRQSVTNQNDCPHRMRRSPGKIRISPATTRRKYFGLSRPGYILFGGRWHCAANCIR